MTSGSITTASAKLETGFPKGEPVNNPPREIALEIIRSNVQSAHKQFPAVK